MIKSTMTLDRVEWGESANVSLLYLGVDRLGSFYIRQGAMVHPRRDDVATVPITRDFRGCTTSIAATELLKLFGKEVHPISSPFAFDIARRWYRLRVSS